MKDRPALFLSEDEINHNGEIFDYIKELHTYLWRFVRTVSPGASGTLDDSLDAAVEEAERDSEEFRELKYRNAKLGKENERLEGVVVAQSRQNTALYQTLEQAERERDAALEKAEYTLDQLATARRDQIHLRRGLANLLV